jgi:hypothetical protein
MTYKKCEALLPLRGVKQPLELPDFIGSKRSRTHFAKKGSLRLLNLAENQEPKTWRPS